MYSLKIHHHLYKIPWLCSVLIQLNSVHILTTYFLRSSDLLSTYKRWFPRDTGPAHCMTRQQAGAPIPTCLFCSPCDQIRSSRSHKLAMRVFSSTPSRELSPLPCPSSTASVPIFSTNIRFVLLLQSCQHTVQYTFTVMWGTATRLQYQWHCSEAKIWFLTM
jgi:hypothetical protein